MKKKRFELVHCLQDSSIPALTGWLRRSWPLWLADPYVPVKDEDEEGGTDYSLGHLPKRKSPKRMSEPGSRLFPRALRRLLWECYTHSLPWNIEWARRTLRWGDELRWTSTPLLYFVRCVSSYFYDSKTSFQYELSREKWELWTLLSLESNRSFGAFLIISLNFFRPRY